MQMKKLLGIALLAAGTISAVQAAPVLELYSGGRAGFESNLTSYFSDGLETQTPGATALTLTPLSLSALGAATLTGTSKSYTGANGRPALLTGLIRDFDRNGRKNTTTTPGAKNYWESALDFSVSFGASPVEAFGFNLTDYGDFKGLLSLEILLADSGIVTISNLKPSSTPSNGDLNFFGISADSASIAGVRFKIAQNEVDDVSAYDWLGFDDLMTGSRAPRNNVPEPGSLALVGISLLGLATARQRKARR